MSKNHYRQVVWGGLSKVFLTKPEKLIHNLTRVGKTRAVIMIVLNYFRLCA
jgi:hypothetical protein